MTFRVAVFLGLLLASASSAQAQPATVVRSFEEGNRLFEQGRYAQAVAAYETAEASGYASGALFYNMGSAHYRTETLGQALRYFEKARAAGLSGDERLAHNLAVLRSRLSEEARASAEERPAFWLVASQRLTAWVPRGWTFGLGLALYLGALGAAAWALWTGRRTARLRRAIASGLAAGLLLAALALTATALASWTGRRAVVIAETAPLRAAPAENAAVQGALPEGFVVRTSARRDGWVQIAPAADSLAGWLPAHAVGAI